MTERFARKEPEHLRHVPFEDEPWYVVIPWELPWVFVAGFLFFLYLEGL